MSHLNIWILAFFTNFGRIKLTCLVTLFDRNPQVFKNSPKLNIIGIFNECPLRMSYLNFSILSFSADFCMVTLFDRKFQFFKTLSKLTIIGIFNEHLSDQNLNVARFARNVE